MKRFYKQVAVAQQDGGWQVTLDGRAIKTVKGAPQLVPNAAFAQALASEWDAQGDMIDAKSLPLRDIADYAIDIVSNDTEALIDKVVAYGDTDTLLYRADPDEPLYERQQAVWEPIVSAFEAFERIELTRVSGILHRPQGDAALAGLKARLADHSPFALAGIEAMTTLAASLVVGLSASRVEDDAAALTLWEAAGLEEDWQAELWGRDEEAELRRAKREADFLKAYEATRLALA